MSKLNGIVQAPRTSRSVRTLFCPINNILRKPCDSHGLPALSAGFRRIVGRSLYTNSSSSDLGTDVLPHVHTDPVGIFHAHLRCGTLNRYIATACLEAADLTNRADGHLGAATINWLWDDHEHIHWSKYCRLLPHMTSLLVREGREELLWDWMEQQPVRRPKSSKSVYSLGWRAYVLELLVLIKASQAAIHRSLDAPLCT